VTGLGDLVVFIGLVAALLVGGVWVGMLLAPRLGRLMDPDDEGPGDDD
jgi:hypothetical protein